MELLENGVRHRAATRSRNADAYMAIVAPENTPMAAGHPGRAAQRPAGSAARAARPFLSDEKPWVGCYYPTDAAAQDAGMPLRSFEDFLYGAVLIDWQELRPRRWSASQSSSTPRRQVRIVGPETDLTFSLEGREGKVDALGANMPGGEIFYSPVEDSAEGVISYSEYPACYLGHEVGGVRFRFEGGTIVDASADERRGVPDRRRSTSTRARAGSASSGSAATPASSGTCATPSSTRRWRARSTSRSAPASPSSAALNRASVHWDMVKELRNGGRIELDGKVVQENGVWQLS